MVVSLGMSISGAPLGDDMVGRFLLFFFFLVFLFSVYYFLFLGKRFGLILG